MYELYWRIVTFLGKDSGPAIPSQTKVKKKVLDIYHSPLALASGFIYLAASTRKSAAVPTYNTQMKKQINHTRKSTRKANHGLRCPATAPNESWSPPILCATELSMWSPIWVHTAPSTNIMMPLPHPTAAIDAGSPRIPAPMIVFKQHTDIAGTVLLRTP